MEIQTGHSELAVISQVSAVEGCPLSRVPLYMLILNIIFALLAIISANMNRGCMCIIIDLMPHYFFDLCLDIKINVEDVGN